MTLVITVATGCGRKGEETASQKAAAPKQPAGGTAQLVPREAAARFTCTAQEFTATSATLTLVWLAGAEAPEEPPVLALCLPPHRSLTARWVGASLDGKAILVRDPQRPAPGEGLSIVNVAGTIEFTGFMRRWPIYRLNTRPEMFSPLRSGNGTHGAYELKLELAWTEPYEMTGAAPARAESPLWRRVAERLVVNAEGLDRFAQAEPPLPADLADATLGADPRLWVPGERKWLRMESAQEGLVRVSMEDFLAAGLTAAELKAEHLRVYSHGEAIPTFVAPGPGLPAQLAPGVYFWARAGEGPYAQQRAYWLTFDGALPAVRPQVAELKWTTETETIESIGRVAVSDVDTELVTRHGNFLAIEGMAWVNAPIKAQEPLQVGLELPGYIADQPAPNSEATFFLESEVALHQTELQVQTPGNEPLRLKFFGSIDMKKNFQLPSNSVANEKTTITLALTAAIPQQVDDGSADPLWLDRVAVHYRAAPRLLAGRMTIAADVASSRTAWTPLLDLDSANPPALIALEVSNTSGSIALCPITQNAEEEQGLLWSRQGGERYEVYDVGAIPKAPPAEPVEFDDLRQAASTVELLIITHREFSAAAEQLAAHRRARGTSTRVVNIEQVYNQFNAGELSPHAIRAFLTHAMRSWPGGGPGAVILVGDCTSDYLNVSRGPVKNWVPSYTYSSGSETWASDYWMSRLAGDDDLGDIMLTRISVANLEDAQAQVAKIIAYDTTPQPGAWRARLGFVADDGEFPGVVDSLRTRSTPQAYDARRVFLSELPLEDNWILPENYVDRKGMKVSKAATEAILKTFREGVSFLTYYGHGSPNIWSDERIWFGGNSKNSDNLFLANTGHAAFIANMTCNSGAIDYPSTPWNICITEDLMRVPNGGAIACYVPSGPGVTSVHQNMSKLLHRALFEDGARTLGEVIALTKTRFTLAQFPSEMVYMYHLLGDPLVDLQLTADSASFTMTQPELGPGGEVKEVLWGMGFAAGQWQAELVDAQAGIQWSSAPETFEGGAIPLQFTLPKDLASGNYVLRVYLWDEASGKDLAAAAALNVVRPRVTIAAPRLTNSGEHRPEFILQNRSAVPVEGWAELLLIDGATTRTLSATTVTLAAQEERALLPDPNSLIAFDASTLAEQPRLLESRFRPSRPADDSAAPAVERAIGVLAIEPGYARWVPSEITLETQEAGRNAMLSVMAAIAPPAQPGYALELSDTTGTLITTATLPVQNAVGHTTLTLSAEQLQKLAGGAIRLTRASQPGAAPELLDSLAFESIHKVAAKLSFVPGTLRIEPEHPSEGHTVFIHVEVENTGTAIARNFQINLLDGEPQKGGRPAADQMDRSRAHLPDLGPGRRTTARLRWDPIRNAGTTPLWVVIQGEGQVRTRIEAQETLPIQVTALTKAKFKLVDVSAEATDADRKANRVQLKAIVGNEGQTAAHRVMVSFFRSEIQNEENKLGEVEIPEIPGESEQAAEFTWTYDPMRDMVKGTQLPTPTAQVWLKGSTQRVSSAALPSPSPTPRR